MQSDIRILISYFILHIKRLYGVKCFDISKDFFLLLKVLLHFPHLRPATDTSTLRAL